MTGQRQAVGANDGGSAGSGNHEAAIRVSVGGRTATGECIDLSPSIPADRLARAIRGEDVDGVAVEAPTPGPVNEYVGVVDGRSVPVQAALAAAARSRGEDAPQDAAIARCRAELAELEPTEVDLAGARRRVAEYSEEETRLDERVAELRGRVQTLRDRDDQGSLAESEAELEDAVAALTEARTERIAAEQAVERARDRAREARDVRERRLELEDRIGNLQRAARGHLAETVFSDFRDALSVVPGGEDGDPDGPGDFEGDATTAALAIARIADCRAPVILDCCRFGDAVTAAEVLDAPVVRLVPA